MATYTTAQGQDFQIMYASSLPSGHGHRKIEIEVCSKSGDLKMFSATTSNMPSFDEANELEGQKKYEALFEIIESDIDGEISEWIYELDSED